MTAEAVLLAIPAFNEEATIDRVLRSVLPHGLPVLVLDDGSTDATAERIARHPVESIRHRANRGYGRAMQDIFHAADADGFEWVITMDCDEQHCPSCIPDFLREIRAGRCDIASGTRYLRPDAPGHQAPGRRREVNMAITGEVNRRLGAIPARCGTRTVLGPGITDAFCGFKAYRVPAVRSLPLDVDGYDFPLQFWVQAAAHGLRVDEIPVPRIYLDPNRSFGGGLDDADRRLAVYRATFEREIARCADLFRAAVGKVP